MKIFESPYDFTTSLRKALDDIDPYWESYRGLIIPGSHTTIPQEMEERISAITTARETGEPFLGICLGYQLAAIEYARTIMGIRDATSEEWSKQGTFVVKKRKEGLNVGEKDGQTYWNNYEVTIPCTFPEWFFVCQFHPEYQSAKEKPHPILTEFINTCRSAG